MFILGDAPLPLQTQPNITLEVAKFPWGYGQLLSFRIKLIITYKLSSKT